MLQGSGKTAWKTVLTSKEHVSISCVLYPVKAVSILIGSGCWGALGRKGARQRAEATVMAGQELTAAACPSSCWKKGRGLPVTTRTVVSKVSGQNSGAPCAGAPV